MIAKIKNWFFKFGINLSQREIAMILVLAVLLVILLIMLFNNIDLATQKKTLKPNL